MRDFYIPHEVVIAPHSDELITKQEFKQECDVYNILKQFQKTGVITHINQNRPKFEDLPDAIDFQESLNTIIRAEDAFAALPASVRDTYGNDPRAFLEALSDPTQTAKLTELGILTPPAAPRPPDPQTTPVSEPPA